MGAFNGN